MSTSGGTASQRGTALVLTLWLLALLSALALNFALSARTGSAITRNFKESVMLRALAVEAIENTVAYLLSDPDPLVDYVDEDGSLRTDSERPPASGSMSSGTAIVYITLSAEDARLNINELNDKVLGNLLALTTENEEDRNALISSLKDWIDPDNLHRLGGAEDDYYIPLGYESAGVPLTVTDELMLIKGFSKEILRGEDGIGGLSDKITTFAHAVNINAAPAEVLVAMGLDTLSANSLIDTRSTNEGLRQVPYSLSGKATTFSNVFRIEVQATLAQSPQVYHITSIVERIAGIKSQELKTIYWKENIEAGGA
jgi:general secretion pathway protein K